MRRPGVRLWPLDERGTIWDALVGAAVVVLGLGATLTGTVAVSHYAHQTIPAEAQLADLSNLVDGATRDAHSSIALFTPPRDVAGDDNSDGHELDFYARDAKGAGHFWAYCFRGAAGACAAAQPLGTVARYHYAWPDLVQNGGAGPAYDGATVPNITSLSVRNVPASQLLDPSVNAYSAAYLAAAGVTHITDVAQSTGYPGVTSGNNVAILTATNASGTRTVHLLAQQLAPSRAVPVATYTPAPNPFALSSGSIAFRNPIAAAQTVTLSESNYGVRTTTPPQVYTITSDTCTPDTTESPGSPIAPAGDGSGYAVVTLAPIKQLTSGESCAYTFTDNAPQNDVLTVSVGGTFAPSITGPPGGFVRLGGASSIAVPFTFAENNYDVAASGGGIVSLSASGSCSSASVSAESMNGPNYTATVSATATAAGQCTITATDTYGQIASSSASVYGVLSVSPDPIAFANPGSAPVLSVISDPGYTGTFNGQVIDCTNGVVATRTHDGDQYHVTWRPAGPSGQCTWQISDGTSVVDIPVVVGFGPLAVAPDPIAFANPSSSPIATVVSDPGFTGTLTGQVINCTSGVDAWPTAGADQFHATWYPQGPSGTCTWVVSDGVNTVNVPVTVGVAPTPNPAPTRGPLIVNPTTLTLPSIGATAGFTVSEANYTGTFTIESTQAQGSDCSYSGTILGHPRTLTLASVSPEAQSATSTTPVDFTVTEGINAASCTMFVIDDGTNPPAPVQVNYADAPPPGPISFSPAALTWNPSDTEYQWAAVNDPGFTGTVYISSDCAGFTMGNNQQSGVQVAALSAQSFAFGSGSTLSIALAPNTPGTGQTCGVTASDGNTIATLPVTDTYGGPDPPYPSTCPNAQPWPNCVTSTPSGTLVGNASGVMSASRGCHYSGADNQVLKCMTGGEAEFVSSSITYGSTCGPSLWGFEGLCIVSGMYVNVNTLNPVSFVLSSTSSYSGSGCAVPPASQSISAIGATTSPIIGDDAQSAVGTMNPNGTWSPPALGIYWIAFGLSSNADGSTPDAVCTTSYDYLSGAYQ